MIDQFPMLEYLRKNHSKHVEKIGITCLVHSHRELEHGIKWILTAIIVKVITGKHHNK